ncbi:MAG: AAA family ATPase [Candidatus Bathyarchaeia archaeon]
MKDGFIEYVMAGYPLLWVETHEEHRALVSYAAELSAAKEKYDLYTWDCADGIRPIKYDSKKGFEVGSPITWAPQGAGDPEPLTHPMRALQWMEEAAGRPIEIDGSNILGNVIIFFKDFHPFLDMDKAPNNAVPVIRKIRNLIPTFKGCGKVIVVISSEVHIPPEITKEITVVPFSLPDREGLRAVLKKACEDSGAPYPKDDEAIIDASLGMTYFEAENAFSVSLVRNKKFDAKAIREEKSAIVRKDKILEVVDTEITLNEVGGLEILKETLVSWKNCFTEKARQFGVRPPKAMLLGGIAGCGKSLTAKAVATAWGRPLLRLDMGAVFDKWVGESESKIREVFKLAEAMAPVVLWIDEIEKSLSGDHEVTKRVKSTMLTWMQEHTSDVFIVATANEVNLLDAALLRRFNYVFWVDLPDKVQREEILKIHLQKKGRDPKKFQDNMNLLTDLSEGFNGSGIEDWVDKATQRAFNMGHADIELEDLVETSKEISPITKLNAEEIAAARGWAKNHNARSASISHLSTTDTEIPTKRKISIN